MRINMTAKAASVSVNSVSFEVEPFKLKEQTVNFLRQLESEVKQGPTLAKKFLNLLLQTRQTYASLLVLSPAIALDPGLIQSIVIIMITILLIGVSSAIVAYMGAGIWRIWWGGTQAVEWTQNITKGLAQILLAPVIVSLMVGLCILLFSNLPAFSPFAEPLKTWWHQR